MAIDLTEKVLPRVDEIFTAESKKAILTNDDFDWSGAHTVKVYKVSTSSMHDYNRDGANNGSRYGTVESLNATTEEFMLKKDRSFTFEIDKLDKDETQNQLEASTALARQLREVVIPEIDTYTYNIMCAEAGTIPEPQSNAIPNDLYEQVLTASQALDDKEVPENGRILVVTPETLKILKNATNFLLSTTQAQDIKLNGVIGMVDGLNVVKVPSKRLPVDFSFMLCHPVATVAPTKLEDYTVHENPPGISGSLVEGRICYDAFVLPNKRTAIYYQRKPLDSSTRYTEDDLNKLTKEQIFNLAKSLGYTMTTTTRSLKTDIITEFLTQQGE